MHSFTLLEVNFLHKPLSTVEVRLSKLNGTRTTSDNKKIWISGCQGKRL